MKWLITRNGLWLTPKLEEWSADRSKALRIHSHSTARLLVEANKGTIVEEAE